MCLWRQCGSYVCPRQKRENGKERPQTAKQSTFDITLHYCFKPSNLNSVQVEEWLPGSLTKPLGNIRQPIKRIRNACRDRIAHSTTHSLTHSLTYGGVRTALDRITATELDLVPTLPIILHSHCFCHCWAALIDLTWMNEWMNEWMSDWLAGWLTD